VSVKDRAVLAPMASLELCTDHTLGFVGPVSLVPCNYFAEPHPCLNDVVGGGMRPRAKTSPVAKGLILAE
jgi:hypothetical protein